MRARAITTPLPLSPRQTEILRLYAHGFTGKEIAAKLGISPNTIHVQTAEMRLRLGADNIAHAVFLYLVHYRSATHVVPACTETHPAVFPPRYVRGVKSSGDELNRWACFECEKISQQRMPQRNNWPPQRERRLADAS